MDKRILLTIFFVILIVGGILLFKVIFPPCSNPEIKILTEHPMVGQIVSFSAITEDEEEVQWDFGDSTYSSGAEGVHIYKVSGSYTVAAKVGECSAMKQIIVEGKKETARVVPVVKAPEIINANDRVTFRDETPEAQGWKWGVEETRESGTSASFPVVFKKPGKYTITLAVKGEYITGDTTFSIQVLASKQAIVPPKPIPAPPRPVPAPPKPAPAPPKPVPAPPKPPKPDPVSTFMNDAVFEASFVRIANDFSDESSGASEDWKLIVEQGCGQSMIVFLVDEVKTRQISLENFKTILIAEGGFYISEAKVLKRAGGPGTCITSIRVHKKSN